jgi:hypothetical protein
VITAPFPELNVKRNQSWPRLQQSRVIAFSLNAALPPMPTSGGRVIDVPVAADESSVKKSGLCLCSCP